MTTPEGPAATREPAAGRCICGHIDVVHTKRDERMEQAFPGQTWNGCQLCGCFFFRPEDEISIGLQDGSLRMAPDPADEIASLRARLVEVERWRSDEEQEAIRQLHRAEAAESRALAAEARLSGVEGALRETRPMVEAHRRKLLVEVQQHEKAADAEDIGDLPEVLTRASAIAQASDVLRAIDAALAGAPPSRERRK